MREIEFRGKDIETGKWAFGDLHTLCDKPHIHTDKSKFPYAGKRSFVTPETVGQFTGLLDKNGKKIFEGDIVRKRDLTFNLQYEGVVVYNSAIGCFRIHSESGGMTMRMGFEASDVYNDGQCTVPVKYDYEVIGNIFDNHELINK